jgi:paraquat-inducible protein A
MKNIEQCLALTISALLLFFIANSSVFINVLIQNEWHQFIVFQSTIVLLFQDNTWYLALPMVLFVLIIPLLELLLLLSVLGGIYFEKSGINIVPLIRMLHILRQWSMAEVFLVSVLVAMIKVYSFGSVVFGFGIFAFALMVVMIGIVLNRLDWAFIWSQVRE